MDAEGEKDELQGVVEDLQTEKAKLCEELDSKQVYYSFFIWPYQSEALYSYPVLDSDTSSACNFCARFSDVISPVISPRLLSPLFSSHLARFKM